MSTHAFDSLLAVSEVVEPIGSEGQFCCPLDSRPLKNPCCWWAACRSGPLRFTQKFTQRPYRNSAPSAWTEKVKDSAATAEDLCSGSSPQVRWSQPSIIKFMVPNILFWPLLACT